MIQKYVDRFIERQEELRKWLMENEHPSNYKVLVEKAIDTVTGRDATGDVDYGEPDPSKIHEIDDGHYQGTLLFIIPQQGYQPSDYWYIKVSYGSCSGCDTLQAICGYEDGKPTANQAEEYLQLMRDIVTGLRPMQTGDRDRLVRQKAIEDVAAFIETNAVWISLDGKVSLKPSTREDIGVNYRALADEVRKLKDKLHEEAF